MSNTGMSYYGLGTNGITNAYGVSSTNDILTNAYSNPMVMCSPTGNINVNGAVMPTNYENDFLMPKFDIGNCLNGQVSMQGNNSQSQVGDQFVNSQIPQQVQQNDLAQQTVYDNNAQPQEQLPQQVSAPVSLKKNGAILGLLSPVIYGAYKVFKGASASSVFNKELLVKCPILGIAGVALASLAEKFLNKSNA